MSTIVKNIHIFKDGAWHPIKKVFKDSSWRTMKGIYYEGVWYEIGASCVIMPDDKQGIDTEIHPYWAGTSMLTVYGTNNFGLNLLPGGTRSGVDGSFLYLLSTGYWWADPTENKDLPDSHYDAVRIYYNSNAIPLDVFYEGQHGLYVRACKNYTGTEPTGTLISNAYTDGSGRSYSAVVIGNLLIINENLKTTKFQDGSNLSYVTNDIDWYAPVSVDYDTYQYVPLPGYCYYDHSISYGNAYGYIYNHYAVHYYRTTYPGNSYVLKSGKYLVSGDGWRVTTIEDWEYLVNYLTTTNWCGGLTISSNNVAQYLKSERQKDHYLAPSMSVSPNSFNVDKYGGTFYFDISSNYNYYTISGLYSWVRNITPATASGNTRVYFTILSNEGVPPFQTSSRTASLSIKDSIGQTITTVSIYQEGDIIN